jgi:hypothetical protein
MLPLGDCWDGLCHAQPASPFIPDSSDLIQCNLGYARGACSRFPDSVEPDAVRFTISRHDGANIGLYYVIERNHLPLAHGPLEYAAGEFRNADAFSGSLLLQASAYVRSYLHRKLPTSAD